MASDRAGPIWDAPTRVFHWALAILIPFSWWSATHDHLPWHRLSGYAILAMLLFRIGWGFLGPPTARFSRLLAGPARVRAYLSGRLPPFVGHNPLGGWSVAVMLAALAVQVGLGLFSSDIDGFEAGPLSRFISFDASRAVAHVHHIVFWIVVGLIVLHLGAVAFHQLRGRDLVGPMVTGRGPIPDGDAAPAAAPAWRAWAVGFLALALAWFVAHGLRLSLSLSGL